MTVPQGICETCPGCGLVLPVGQAGGHAYFGATASCYSIFSDVLAREYGDPAYRSAHRVTVDAYAAQHPGEPGRRSIQSVNVHLVGLHLMLERHLRPEFVRTVIGSLTKQKGSLHWLEPPHRLGSITVMDVSEAQSPADHVRIVQAWGWSVWEAWAPHHSTIAALAARAVADLG